MIGDRCQTYACKFIAVGELHVTSPFWLVEHVIHLCWVHRDIITQQAIDSPKVDQVIWTRIDGWANDGAKAAA